MARRAAVLVLALLLAPLATVDAQTAPAAPAAPGAPIAAPASVTPITPGVATLPSVPPAATPTTPGTPSPTPGNPSSPGDFTNNPHPEMPWFGIGTPYGQFVRWGWVPPRVFNIGGRVVQQPGFWVAETTAGYYYVDHWELAQGPTGQLSWRVIPRTFVPR